MIDLPHEESIVYTGLSSAHENYPSHVAVIMDGNGRWASKRGLARKMGHFAATKKIKPLIYEVGQLGIKYFSLYCFSTENWKRPKEEVDSLFDLMTQYIRLESDELSSWGVRVRFIGQTDQLPKRTRDAMKECEKALDHNRRYLLNFFVSYGGRDEILSAAKSLATDVKEGIIAPDDINEQSFSKRLYTRGIPDPDLVIRTSGEQRLSNFMLWQMAYSELYVSDILWPDFGPKQLRKACEDYSKRQRRFGGVKGK